MTILQLKIAVSIAELKSVTAAAKLNNISQPNASSCLKQLEESLGFTVFMRAGTKLTPTPKGSEFLIYARQMLDANEKAMNLRNAGEVYRLRLGTLHYYTAAEPFFDLCNEHKDDENNDFRYCNVTISGGIQALSGYDLDVIAIPVRDHQTDWFLRQCSAAGLEATSICRVPATMTVRVGHPITEDKNLKYIVQGSDIMRKYPYVGIKSLSDDTGTTALNDSDFVPCSYKIYADDTNTRMRIIGVTNGFGFGISSSYKLMNRFNVTCIPVKDVSPELFCVTRRGESGRREIQDYLTGLKKEMLRLPV